MGAMDEKEGEEDYVKKEIAKLMILESNYCTPANYFRLQQTTLEEPLSVRCILHTFLGKRIDKVSLKGKKSESLP
jgi:hypothetical protein